MKDLARDALTSLLLEYGPSVIETPQILGTLLHKQARLTPQDVKALLAAVEVGIPRQIHLNPYHDCDSLGRMLTMNSKLSNDKAKWVVRTWMGSIAAAKRPPGAPLTPFRVLAALATAGIVGTLAYFVFVG